MPRLPIDAYKHRADVLGTVVKNYASVAFVKILTSILSFSANARRHPFALVAPPNA
jgi:hypothetical protein